MRRLYDPFPLLAFPQISRTEAAVKGNTWRSDIVFPIPRSSNQSSFILMKFRSFAFIYLPLELVLFFFNYISMEFRCFYNDDVYAKFHKYKFNWMSSFALTFGCFLQEYLQPCYNSFPPWRTVENGKFISLQHAFRVPSTSIH